MPKLWTMALRTLAVVAALLAAPAVAAPVSTGHVTIELAPQDEAAVPGGVIYVALSQVMEPGWHTYWRNPGDSGLPTKIAWTLPPGWRAGDIVWPLPERISTGEGAAAILNYVYSGKVLLAVPIEVPASARPGDLVTIKAAVSYLVCKDVCVPEDGVVTLAIPVAATSTPHPIWGQAVTDVLAAAPKDHGFMAVYQRSAGRVRLSVTDPALAGANLTGADFFAFSPLAAASKAPVAKRNQRDWPMRIIVRNFVGGSAFALRRGVANKTTKRTCANSPINPPRELASMSASNNGKASPANSNHFS